MAEKITSANLAQNMTVLFSTPQVNSPVNVYMSLPPSEAHT